ncbi:hypothetical protein [Flexivirga oryzae]|uniref:DNA-binding protein n=1 Tax=Flexivirga oryzae TaxID=1794944 RepID=A0A839N5N5_9MICO|nr:hypothetical protein [Flexivirga oryzae]MBB2890042.1 hypothetical protein [Flexivirga oryzae]
MTSMIHDLDRVLADHRASMSPQEFMEILIEATESTDTMTAAERSFLVEHGGVPADAVDPAHQTVALVRNAADTAAAQRHAVEQGYTTGQVATKFGMKPANIRRDVSNGRLYVAGRARTGEHVFPRWQFTDDGPLPGLRDVLAALPADHHPLDVAAFMTTPQQSLNGRSPAAWLATGGAVHVVAELADELGRQ